VADSSKAISVEIKGVEELNAAFKKAPQIAVGELRRAILKALITLQGEARKFVVKDTGRLVNAIRYVQPTMVSGKLTAETQYAIYVHEGTKPHFPPLSAVEPWAKRHGVPALVVARAIARKGTKANPFFDEAKKSSAQSLDSIFKNAIDKIINQLT